MPLICAYHKINQMRITPITTYAVRCMVYLKDHPNEVTALKAIAAGTVIPYPFLSKILQNLVRHGFVKSAKGKKGGFRLAQPPENISLSDIVRATSRGGTLLRTACCTGTRNCVLYKTCKVRGVWKDLEGIVEMHLQSRKISQL